MSYVLKRHKENFFIERHFKNLFRTQILVNLKYYFDEGKILQITSETKSILINIRKDEYRILNF